MKYGPGRQSLGVCYCFALSPGCFTVPWFHFLGFVQTVNYSRQDLYTCAVASRRDADFRVVVQGGTVIAACCVEPALTVAPTGPGSCRIEAVAVSSHGAGSLHEQ